MSVGRKRRRALAVLAVLFILSGAFFVGIGLGRVEGNKRLRDGYQAFLSDESRDRHNRTLAENMAYVSINRVLHMKEGSAEAEADITVDEKSSFGCIVTVIRDATGEQLYQSGVIDPGHYIRKIKLKGSLKDGYYPCTAVWSYYAEGDQYAGETAWKVVVVVGE